MNTKIKLRDEVPPSSSLFKDFLMETDSKIRMCDLEYIIIQKSDIPAFPKSWIIYCSLGLIDKPTRKELKKGFQPWNSLDKSSLWVFNNLLCPTNGNLNVDEAQQEWCSFMRYWTKLTLNNGTTKIFNPVNTVCGQQIGVHMRANYGWGKVLCLLDIFLQPIEEEYYTYLHGLHYKNLYKDTTVVDTVECKGHYILFGPGTIPRRPNTPHKGAVFNTGCITRSLMHFQYGCGQTYDADEETYVYYDGKI